MKVRTLMTAGVATAALLFVGGVASAQDAAAPGGPQVVASQPVPNPPEKAPMNKSHHAKAHHAKTHKHGKRHAKAHHAKTAAAKAPAPATGK